MEKLHKGMKTHTSKYLKQFGYLATV